MSFKLISTFQPQGDQPQAIEQLVNGVEAGEQSEVVGWHGRSLLGAAGEAGRT